MPSQGKHGDDAATLVADAAPQDPQASSSSTAFASDGTHRKPSSSNGYGPGAAPQYPKFVDLIYDTPIVDLTSLADPKVPGVKVLAKCEFMSPGLSIKDRIMKHILDSAIANKDIPSGGTVVAASSGNTGAATAMLCAMRGLNAVITTSSKCSKEKMDSIKAYGATLLVSKPGIKEGCPGHYMEMENELCAEHSDWYSVDQYNNKNNPKAHYLTLGPEIWRQTHGTVTHFVCGGSTGGTISGTGRYLKEQNGGVKVILADPVGSIFAGVIRDGMTEEEAVSKGKDFLVEGVGKGAIPGAMDTSLIDEVLSLTDNEAFTMCHKLAGREGILAGGSAGLNVAAAVKLANEATEPCTIVTVMPDSGAKYLSKVYNHEWLAKSGVELSL